MKKHLVTTAAAGLVALGMGAGGAAAQGYELVVPSFDYRTGPFAPSGIPVANGFADYITLLNERDGGIEGIKVKIVPCETAYNTQQGVECYEKTKGIGPSGALVIAPYSTGITYQIIPKASVDKIPILSMGYGRTSAANGRVFEWVFNPPATYWSQASATINYIAEREGGHDKLKGKKITLVYHNSAYGKEPIPTLEALAKKHGFTYTGIAVDSPGQEQKAAWLQIRRDRPDWVLLWGWGVMNQVAVKEAASIRFPMDKFIGVWWSGSEADVAPSAEQAKGYISATFHTPGPTLPVHQEILKHVYDKGKAVDPSFKPRVGEVLYNRGMANALFITEAIRNAMRIHKTKEVKAVHVRDGLEALEISNDLLKARGFPGFMAPFKVTCANHEGSGEVMFQQWDGAKWSIINNGKRYTADRSVVDALIKADSEKYAADNKITPRACS
jgi:branched-chain amino acid transport system substrate-binding protein